MVDKKTTGNGLDIKESALDNMVKAGRILQRLNPKLNAKYTVILQSDFRTFEYEGRTNYKVVVSYDGMDMDLITPKTLIMAMLADLKRKGLKIKDENGEFTVKEGIGMTLKFQKLQTGTPKYPDAVTYSGYFED